MLNPTQCAILCHNIRFLRQAHRLSRTAMACRLHITRKNLTLLEAGVFPERIHIGFLNHVWEAFGVPPLQLISLRLPEA